VLDNGVLQNITLTSVEIAGISVFLSRGALLRLHLVLLKVLEYPGTAVLNLVGTSQYGCYNTKLRSGRLNNFTKKYRGTDLSNIVEPQYFRVNNIQVVQKQVGAGLHSCWEDSVGIC
jgi:hypothetical protein